MPRLILCAADTPEAFFANTKRIRLIPSGDAATPRSSSLQPDAGQRVRAAASLQDYIRPHYVIHCLLLRHGRTRCGKWPLR